MGMSWKRKWAIRDNLKNAITFLFYCAKTYGYTSEQLNERYLEKINQFKIPNWMKQYLQGVFDCHMGLAYLNELEFCYIVDELRISTRKESPIYYEKLNISVRELTDHDSGHFWIKTGKPFFMGDR